MMRKLRAKVAQFQARRAQSRLEKLVMRNGGVWFPGDAPGQPRSGALVIAREDLLADTYRREPDYLGRHVDDDFFGATLDGGRAGAGGAASFGEALDAHLRDGLGGFRR